MCRKAKLMHSKSKISNSTVSSHFNFSLDKKTDQEAPDTISQTVANKGSL